MHQNPEIAVILKQAYIFGQEMEGKEDGSVKNVKNVLNDYKQLNKTKDIDEDEAFRYNAESALVFYRVKSYDVASFISSDV